MKKKVMFLVVIFFSFCKNIYAETYYGEYRKVIDVGNYKHDEVMIDSYKLYNTYKIDYVDMGYMLENDDYIKDENDFKEELVNVDINEFSDEYINFPTNLYSTTGLSLINNNKYNIKIYELEIYVNDTKKGYGYTGVGKDISNLYDGNLDTFYEIQSNELFGLNIYISYLIKDIKIVIYTKDDNNNSIRLTMRNNDFDFILNDYNHDKHIITFDNEYENYEYKTIKTLYRYYKEEKVKLDNYVNEGDNILLDDYILYENFYVRDKLVLKDNLVIDNKDNSLYDLIEYSTDKVNINCDINYDVNGIYDCEFVLNDIKIYKDVVVNIPSSDSIQFEEEKQIDNRDIIEKIDIKETEESVNDVQLINTIDKGIKKVAYNKVKSDTISNKDNQITDNKVSKVKNDKIKNDSKINVKQKNNKIIMNVVKIVIFINIILIESILFIKKRKRNNVERV